MKEKHELRQMHAGEISPDAKTVNTKDTPGIGDVKSIFKKIRLHDIAQALVMIIFLLIISQAALAANNLMALQGNAYNGTTPLDGDLRVTIYDSPAGGNLIYDSVSDYDGAIADGKFDVMLGDGSVELSLEYGKLYYLDMSVNGQDLDFDGSERRLFQSSVGSINGTYITNASVNKTRISTIGSWLESEIPSLTNSWTGTVNSTKISSQNLMNVNSSQFCSFVDGFNSAAFFANDSSLRSAINAVNSTIAAINVSSVNSNISQLLTNDSNLRASINAVNNTVASINVNSNISALITNDSNLRSSLTAINITIGLVNTSVLQLNANISLLIANDSSIRSALNAVNVSVGALNTSVLNLNSTKAGVGDCSPGMIVQNITASGVECIDAPSSSSSWDVWDAFSRKYYYREAMFESVTSGYNEPWIGTAIGAGTSALFATTSAEHPGVATMSTSTTASSGYSWQITGTTTYLLGDDYVTKATFRPITKTGNVTVIRFGFTDSFTSTQAADGVYFNITQNGTNDFTVRGESRNNNAQSSTSSKFTMKNGTWYATIVYVNNANLATFTIFNETEELWSDTVTSNIPTGAGRQTSNGFIAYTVGGTTAQIVAYMDYIAVGVNRTLVR